MQGTGMKAIVALASKPPTCCFTLIRPTCAGSTATKGFAFSPSTSGPAPVRYGGGPSDTSSRWTPNRTRTTSPSASPPS